MLDFSVIIVSWNVQDLLQGCLQSLVASSTLQVPSSRLLSVEHETWNMKPGTWNMEIIVVDNASSDGSVDMVRQSFPQVWLIANESNLGFTHANNQGLAASQGRYVLLLNPDTAVVGPAVATLLAFLEVHPDVGVVGPQLRYPDGSVQPSRRRFPTLATAFVESTVLQPLFAGSSLLRRYYVADQPDDVTQDVDWLVGACLLVRREAIAQAGPLDEGFFMYSEELDWCRRIKQVGWRIVYLPTAQVIHYEGKSSEQNLAARDIRFNSSKVRYFRKHHGVWQAELLRLFLLGTFVWQLAVESLKWLVGHKRPLRAGRVRAYLQVLGSGLRGAI
jgi:N-acetylglucosaminyl-diphospho-decaprenol L-rhamnosyltransferase